MGAKRPYSTKVFTTFRQHTASSIIGAIVILSGTYSLAPPASAVTNNVKAVVQEGMRQFREGRIAESVASFDESLRIRPEIEAFLWQRGISLYYMNDFVGCASQFKKDVAVNPADTEEVVWAALCDSKLGKTDPNYVASNMLTLPRPDPRPIMSDVYRLFKGDRLAENALRTVDKSQPGNFFYSRLYLGLYYEGRGEAAMSEPLMKEASESTYCSSSSDYMCAVAKNHLNLRVKDF